MHSLEGSFGVDIIRFFQSGIVGESLYYLLLPFHYLGSEIGYLLLLPLIYWTVNKELGKQLFILVLLSTIFTNLLKNWWQRPRPFQVAPDKISPIEPTSEFGLPSGHTIFGTILGLSFAKWLTKRWQIIASIIFLFVMGISRMVHGMHFLQDVVLGWFLGWLFFFVFHKLRNRFIQPFNALSLSVKLLLVAIISLTLFLLLLIPDGDFEYRKSLLSPLGAVFGGAIGIIIESAQIGFADTKKVKTKILRAFTGLFSTVIFYFLLNVIYYRIVGENESEFILFLYLIRYSLIGFWITAGAPYLFSKIKLN